MQSCAPVRSRGRFRMQMCPISDSISDLLKATALLPRQLPRDGATATRQLYTAHSHYTALLPAPRPADRATPAPVPVTHIRIASYRMALAHVSYMCARLWLSSSSAHASHVLAPAPARRPDDLTSIEPHIREDSGRLVEDAVAVLALVAPTVEPREPLVARRRPERIDEDDAPRERVARAIDVGRRDAAPARVARGARVEEAARPAALRDVDRVRAVGSKGGRYIKRARAVDAVARRLPVRVVATLAPVDKAACAYRAEERETSGRHSLWGAGRAAGREAGRKTVGRGGGVPH